MVDELQEIAQLADILVEPDETLGGGVRIGDRLFRQLLLQRREGRQCGEDRGGILALQCGIELCLKIDDRLDRLPPLGREKVVDLGQFLGKGGHIGAGGLHLRGRIGFLRNRDAHLGHAVRQAFESRGVEQQALGEGFLVGKLGADDVDLVLGSVGVAAERFEAGEHVMVDAVALRLDRPQRLGLLAHPRAEAGHPFQRLALIVAGQQALENPDAVFLPVDRLRQRGAAVFGRRAGEIQQARLQVFEIADILDGRACHGHVTVEHRRGIISDKADPGDQGDERHHEQQHLGDDSAALQKTINGKQGVTSADA